MVQHPVEDVVSICCSFCGKQRQQIKHITAGLGGVAICNECVDLCQNILVERGTIDLLGTESPFFIACPSCHAGCLRADAYCSHYGQKLEHNASPIVG